MLNKVEIIKVICREKEKENTNIVIHKNCWLFYLFFIYDESLNL